MESVASIEFDFEPRDVVAFNVFHHLHSPRTRRLIAPLRVLPPICLLLIALLQGLRHGFGAPATIAMFVTTVVIGPLWSLFFPLLFRRILARQVEGMLAEGKAVSFGKTRILLTREHVEEHGPAEDRRVRWSAVDRIAATEGYLFIYVSPLSAVVVPRRAFESRNSFVAFIENVRDLQARARVADV